MIKKITRITVSVLALVILTNCNEVTFKKALLGEYCYAIPDKFLLNSAFKKQLEILPLDQSFASISLIFPAEHVANRVSGYAALYIGRYAAVEANLEVIISALSSENIEYIESKVHYKDLWLATGSYSESRLGRRVIKDEEVDLYRVYFEKISEGWKFTNINPEDTIDIPSNGEVVGACRERDAAGQPSYSCLHKGLRGYFSIEYWVPKENFQHYKSIDDFIYAELDSWKVGTLAGANCLSNGT